MSQAPVLRNQPGLNSVGNGALHAIEEEEAAEQDEHDHRSGNQKRVARSVASTSNGPAESVNDTSHGIEAVKPTPARGDERGRISDWRSKHPELYEKWDDVANISIEGVKRGHPEADAESGQESEKQKYGKPESCQSRENAAGKGEDREDHEADGKVHQARESGRNGKNQPREIDFGDEALIVHDDVSGGLKGVGEIGPGNKSCEIKNGIGEAV